MNMNAKKEMYSEKNLNKCQRKAFEILKQGKNVFLTGEAGTGKSFLLNVFINYLKKKNMNYVVTAPTGIAAINVGGSTLHRTFNIKCGIVSPENKISSSSVLMKTDVLIVDEISMTRIDIFEYIIKCINATIEEKKGNIQIILVGDFFQLSPVVKNDDLSVISNLYPYFNKGYAFESELWNGFTFVNLDTVVRQDDRELIDNLNKARKGDTSCIDFFNNQSSKKKLKDAITLCPTNKEVRRINDKELKKIKGKEYEFFAEVVGIVNDGDKPVEERIVLKEGARVMSLINDTNHMQYQNGSLGTVIDLDDESVTVKFDNKHIETFNPYSWHVKKYDVDKKNKRVIEKNIGTYTQLPLKLAYAISIHKSQGQTFEKAYLIPSCFANGQLYVALSRITCTKGLHLLKKIEAKDLIADEEVLDFYEKYENAIN